MDLHDFGQLAAVGAKDVFEAGATPEPAEKYQNGHEKANHFYQLVK